MPVRNRNAQIEFEIELERGSKTVEYLVKAEVSPYDPGRLSGPPENCYPPEGGEVEAKSVFWVEEKKCQTCFGAGILKANPFPAGKYKDQTCSTCKGKKVVKIEHERPELEDVVDDEEVMKHLPDEPDGPDCDPDDE